MGHRGEDVIGHPVPEPEDPLLVAGREEVLPFTGEGRKLLVLPGITPNPGGTFRQIPTPEKVLYDPADDRPVEGVLLLEPGGIRLLK